MTSLIPIYSTAFDRTFTTTKRMFSNLRDSGLIPPTKRGRGAGPIDSQGAVAALLAVALADSNSQAVETARRVGSLPMVYAHMEKTAGDDVTVTSLRSVFDYLRDINIRPLNDLGEVLTAVVDAIRSGAFARWTSNGDKTLTLDFNDGGKTAMLFALPLTRTGIFMSFADPESCDERGPSVSRVVRLDERLLQDIANALGPLPNAAPPPALLPLPYQALAIPPPPS